MENARSARSLRNCRLNSALPIRSKFAPTSASFWNNCGTSGSSTIDRRLRIPHDSQPVPPHPRVNPLALIAEVTHRCPLHCIYCSNPLELASVNSELSTEEWIDIFQQSGKLGMLHAHFTGGEPLARPDLIELIAGARTAGLYTNLITSGIGLTESRLKALVDAGLDHIQLSFQDSRQDAANWIAGAKAHAHKIELSRLIRQHKIAFTVNLVVHRQNIDHLDEMIDFIEQLAPERMEIAHTQYYGWALRNRAALLPTRTQLEKATEAVAAAEKRLCGSN